LLPSRLPSTHPKLLRKIKARRSLLQQWSGSSPEQARLA
jgi:hypothetical protein